MTNLQQYEAHKEEFDFYIAESVNGRTHKLEISNDIFKPLIEPFMKANPTVNLNACKDCVIDMLVWTKAEWKKTQKK